MSDPISLDDMSAAVAPTAPQASAAPTGPVSLEDMDKAVQTEPKAVPAAPQFEGGWRKPALVATNMIQGLADAVPATVDFLFGERPRNPNDPSSLAAANQENLVNVARGLEDRKTPEQIKQDVAQSIDKSYPLTKGTNRLLAESGIANRPDLQPQTPGETFLAAGAQGAGAALPGLLTGGGSLPGAALTLGRGALAGVGAEAGHELAPNSEIAPLIGGLAGGAALEAPRALVSGAKAIARPFTAAGQGSALDDLIRGAATNPASLDNLPPHPLPGMDLTLGQLSNDPGIQALERGIQGNTPASQGAVGARATTNNTVIRNAVSSLHSDGVVTNPVDAMADASTNMAGALNAEYATAKARENQAWQGLNATVPITDLERNMTAYVMDLPKAQRQFVPPGIMKIVTDEFNDKEPLNEVTALRSTINTAAREASYAGRFNEARVLNGLDGIVLDHINNLPASDIDPAQVAQYNQARQISADNAARFKTGPVSKVFATDSTGADKVPPTATGSLFFKSGPGALESLQSFLKAAGDNPAALQSAKDYVIANMLKQGSSGRAVDLNGQPKIDFGSLNKYLNNNQHVLESGLFTTDELAHLEDVHRAADMAGRTARSVLPYGSSTAEKIKSGQYVDIPISPIVPKALGMIGGAIGGGHAGGPFGAIIGGLEGGKFAGKLYSGPNAKIGEALEQRLLRPTETLVPPSP